MIDVLKITGYPRSGTTVMTKSLAAGSRFEVLRDERCDAINERYSDEHYRPNPDGLYELSLQRYQEIMLGGKLADANRGLVVKAPMNLVGSVSVIPGVRYWLVICNRPVEEIRESYRRAFQHDASIESGARLFEPCPASQLVASSIVAETTRWCRNRKDFADVTNINFADLLADPTGVFLSLHRKGWPINVKWASEQVDPSLRRVG